MRLGVGPATPPTTRLAWVDAARGAAIAAMAVYHFSWDLRFFGFISADITGDLGWRVFARTIAGSFLFLVGVSLVLAARSGFDRGRYLRRLAVIAAAAAAITAVTWFVFPDGFIFFGILHCIALSSVVALPFLRAPITLVAAASLLSFLAPSLLSGPAFDHPALLWLGLATYFPRTNDYVPLFPWFGAVLAGIAAARLAARLPRGMLSGRLAALSAPSALVWAGRHSLPIYLIHQPILLGLVYLASQVAPPGLAALETSYLESCRSSCIAADSEEDLCRLICACLAEQSKAEGLWANLARDALSADEITRYLKLADACRMTVLSSGASP